VTLDIDKRAIEERRGQVWARKLSKEKLGTDPSFFSAMKGGDRY